LRAGGAFIPYLLGHYWKKASWAGTMASLVIGSTAVVLVEKKVINFFNLDPIFLGLLLSAITFFGLSYIFPNKKDSVGLIEEKYEHS
jgi:SSS family solute:Na+ symporter